MIPNGWYTFARQISFITMPLLFSFLNPLTWKYAFILWNIELHVLFKRHVLFVFLPSHPMYVHSFMIRNVLWSRKKMQKNVAYCAKNLSMNSSENGILYGNSFFSLSLPYSKYACTKYACTTYSYVRTLQLLSGLGVLGFSCSC